MVVPPFCAPGTAGGAVTGAGGLPPPRVGNFHTSFLNMQEPVWKSLVEGGNPLTFAPFALWFVSYIQSMRRLLAAEDSAVDPARRQENAR
jgi:hypothetical protein